MFEKHHSWSFYFRNVLIYAQILVTSHCLGPENIIFTMLQMTEIRLQLFLKWFYHHRWYLNQFASLQAVIVKKKMLTLKWPLHDLEMINSASVPYNTNIAYDLVDLIKTKHQGKDNKDWLNIKPCEACQRFDIKVI